MMTLQEFLLQEDYYRRTNPRNLLDMLETYSSSVGVLMGFKEMYPLVENLNFLAFHNCYGIGDTNFIGSEFLTHVCTGSEESLTCALPGSNTFLVSKSYTVDAIATCAIIWYRMLGYTFSREELKRIEQLAKEHKRVILSQELKRIEQLSDKISYMKYWIMTGDL